MTFAVAALAAPAPSRIVGADAVDISYPGYFEALRAACA
jgi:5-enolpyruvylshikimate-3-phosphate synthase